MDMVAGLLFFILVAVTAISCLLGGWFVGWRYGYEVGYRHRADLHSPKPSGLVIESDENAEHSIGK